MLSFVRGAKLAVLALWVALVGCIAPGPAAPQQAEPGRAVAPKRITAAIRGEPTALNYAVNRAGAGGSPGVTEIDLMVNPGLVGFDAEGRPQARLAEAVPTLENGLWQVPPDGRMETTWRIRPGASWHDGTLLTAHDLVFTATVQQDRDLPLVRHAGFNAIDEIVASDARTVIVRWSRPYIDADSMFSTRIALPIPRHILEEVYQTEKARLPSLPYWTTEYVGTGPFRLREWQVGSHLVLEANQTYALGRPAIGTVEVRFISDPNTLLANVMAGEVELTLGRGLSPEQAFLARDQWRGGRVDFALSSWYGMYPQLLTPHPAVLGDVRFRRALLHALDRPGLVDSLVPGLSEVAHSALTPGTRPYRETERAMVRYGYEPARAAQLIEGLGYVRGADSQFRDAGGQRLSIESRASTDNQMFERLVLATADEWQRAGVAVETVIYPRHLRDDAEYRQTRPGFELVTQPPEVQRFHSVSTPLPENRFRGDNRTRYMNPELDALIDRYFTTIPQHERMEALGGVVRHLTDQVIAIGLLYEPEPMLIGGRLINVAASTQSNNTHEWDVR
jgi:peptide/nickel transport system substrate-binding protein